MNRTLLVLALLLFLIIMVTPRYGDIQLVGSAVGQQAIAQPVVIMKCVDRLDITPRQFLVGTFSSSTLAPKASPGANCAQALSDLMSAGYRIVSAERSEPFGSIAEPAQSTGMIYTLVGGGLP